VPKIRKRNKKPEYKPKEPEKELKVQAQMKHVYVEVVTCKKQAVFSARLPADTTMKQLDQYIAKFVTCEFDFENLVVVDENSFISDKLPCPLVIGFLSGEPHNIQPLNLPIDDDDEKLAQNVELVHTDSHLLMYSDCWKLWFGNKPANDMLADEYADKYKDSDFLISYEEIPENIWCVQPQTKAHASWFSLCHSVGLTQKNYLEENWKQLLYVMSGLVLMDEDRCAETIMFYQDTERYLDPFAYLWADLENDQKKHICKRFRKYTYDSWDEKLYSNSDPDYQKRVRQEMLTVVCGTVLTAMAASYLVWRIVDSIFLTADAQSVDKTQKNLSRRVYARNFRAAKQVRDERDFQKYEKQEAKKMQSSRYNTGNHDFKIGQKLGKADKRIMKEGGWGANSHPISHKIPFMMRDEESSDSEDEEEIVAEAQGPAVNSVPLVNRLCLNTIEGEVTYESGTTFITNFFFVLGTQSFAVKHAFACGRSLEDKVTMISLYARKYQRGSLVFAEHQFKLHLFGDRDLARVVFDSSCPSFRKIDHHLKPFIPGNICEHPGRVSWTPQEVYGESLEIRQVEYGTQAVAKNYRMSTTLANHSFVNERWYEIRNLYGYPGACGFPLVNDVLSDQHPILGIHVGGKGSNSMAVPITQDDIEYSAQFYMSNVSKAETVLPNEVDYVKYDTRHLASDTGSIFNVVPYKGVGMRVAHNLKKKPFIPTVNPIEPSPFQKPIDTGSEILPVIHEVTYLPVRLSSVNGEVSPYAKAISKFSEISVPPMTPLIQEMLLDERMDKYVYGQTVPKLKRKMLTEHEAIFGVPELHIPAMDLTTGIGPPECVEGKKTAQMIEVNHENKTYKLNSEFQARLNYIKECCTNNVLPHLALDMLKIETREKDRVENNSTRLFEAGSKASIFLWKQLTGHLLSHVELYKHEHCIKIGINVHNSEWIELYKQLAVNLDNFHDPGVIAGDCERWDKSMLLMLSQSMSSGIIRNLGYEPEEWQKKFIQNFIHGTLQTTHFSPLGLYETRQGNSSGGPGTSWLNSIYNTSIHVVAFNCLLPEYKWEMEKYLNLAIYGDDSISTAVKSIRNQFNMQTLQKFFKDNFALSYTGCDKNSDIPKFMTLNDANFLCRKFASIQINGTNYILPQLKEDSIKNAVLWIKDPSSPMCYESFDQTVSAALMEWSYYGPDVHTKYHAEYSKRMKALGYTTYYKKFNDHKELWHMYTVH
jgi:hypothetical protein